MSHVLTALLPRFRYLPSQPFRMGTPERELSPLAKRYGGTRESYREESPQHELVLPAFWMAETVVTNGLYAAYKAHTAPDTARQPANDWLAKHPIVDITWHEALACCDWLTQQRLSIADLPELEATEALSPDRLLAFRLPSEAEWEYAARGTDGRAFPWGDEFAPELANTREGGIAQTNEVDAYPAGRSPFGLYDMAGNVWEWTASVDLLYPYQPAGGREDPQRPERRILRGGCYVNPHGYARCACRFRLLPNVHNPFIGFRLALDLA